MDNAIIAQEIINHMHKSTKKKGSLAIKIDSHKAYDSVDWAFLRQIVGTNALLMWSGETFLTALVVLNMELGTRKLKDKEEIKLTLLNSELENLEKEIRDSVKLELRTRNLEP